MYLLLTPSHMIPTEAADNEVKPNLSSFISPTVTLLKEKKKISTTFQNIISMTEFACSVMLKSRNLPKINP